jgi:hypothetical protein
MDAYPHILASANERVYCNSVQPTLLRAKLWEMPASQPEYGAWAEKVLFMLRVTGVGADNGKGGAATAPTVYQLGVKFQIEIPHTEQEQYFYPAWTDLDATGVAAKITEGAPWGTEKSHSATLEPSEGDYALIYSNTLQPSKAIVRTLTEFGRDCRIVLDPWAEGEETERKPYFNIEALAVALS